MNGTSRPHSALGEGTLAALDGGMAQSSPLVQVLSEQLRLLKKADARKDGKQRYEAQCNEWRVVAIILDRLFLQLFALISFIASMVLSIPLAQQE